MTPINDSFFGKSFISIDQIDTVRPILDLFHIADRMKQVILEKRLYEPLKARTIAILFYQPSTRTFTSFHAAANRLGAYVIDIHEMNQFSSAVKGETLPDTIQTIHQTTAADLIVLRHPDDNSSKIAEAAQPVPIINAGSGKAEHPTQALLDLYTLYQQFGRLDNLYVMMVGDLRYGRTIKSLAKLLAVTGRNNRIIFVSPPELAAPKELIDDLRSRVAITESTTMVDALPHIDALYMTRVQKEWFEREGKLDQYDELKHHYLLTRHMVSTMRPESIIMHPLPRAGEILDEVDQDPRAAYFSQMRSGLYVRMALLESILLPPVTPR